MRHFRRLSLVLTLGAASALVACGTAPPTPMGSMPVGSMASPEHMAKMDAQMAGMRAMHDKMMAATPDERAQMKAEHMKSMQDGMAMMGQMPATGMGDMKGMQGMHGDMAQHQMMDKRMEMMQVMMTMMKDQMP